MAYRRVSSAASRICLRYQLFFFIALFLLVIQLLMAYSFYSYHQTETEKLAEWKRRVENLEKAHEEMVPVLGEEKLTEEPPRNNGVGAAEGLAIVPHPKNIQIKTSPKPVPAPLDSEVKESKNNVVKMQNDAGEKKKPRETGVKPRCHVTQKDTMTAILRATTDECKKEIGEIACLQQEGKLYPKWIPKYCPLGDNNTGEYIGCFNDDRHDRLFTGHQTDFRETNSKRTCVNHCLRAGHQYAGTQFGYECWCGSSVNQEKKTTEHRCDSRCAGNKTESCGGFLTVSVYHTGVGSRPYSTAIYVPPRLVPSAVPKAKIAFVLTLNGRALRQVQRLFTAIYHKDHYYYIHVDTRQEYLHREMKALAGSFKNVRVADWQMSTIWGGASLLTMHLRCMKDLLSFKDWDWDYFINLSESDYPIKTMEELDAYVTRFNKKNFVRTHGKESGTPRFIQKQGLDKTFFECETHMWRLGSRELPDGIHIDGGSDWVGLHRDFCEYVTTSKDELVTGLMQYWKYTLLPSESFFHTLLTNSRFCTTMVNNNLHVTNWIREKGCKCQYKQIVDWCGCSPNDFKPSDIPKLMANEHKPVYFARKFEAIVNNQVLNELDTYLFGSFPDNTPGLNSYWQNEYHHLDTTYPTSDIHLTFYSTFANISTQQIHQQTSSIGCSFKPNKVLESTTYSYHDRMQGLLIKYEAKNAADQHVYTLETFLQPQKKYKVLRPFGTISRLKSLEVGTNYDLKEDVFRNYAGLLGPFSDIALAHSWGAGTQFTATVVWVDPAHVIAASYDIPIKPEENIALHTPVFAKPLRPGVWTVKLLYLWEVAAEVEFLISPLTYYGGRPIMEKEAPALHNGPADSYTKVNFKQVEEALALQDSDVALEIAGTNGQKTGIELTKWAQELTLSFWHVSDSCVAEVTHSACQKLPICEKTSWSSLSPDPKSEVGPVDTITGRIR